MIEHVKRVMKKKSVIGLLSVMAVTGTVIGIRERTTTEPIRYVLAATSRGSIVTSVAVSGQVSAENQLDVTPRVSGAIVRTFVGLGQEVKTDTPLFQIDSRTAVRGVRDAEQAIRDAQISLQSAQIAYEKVLTPQNETSVLQAQHALNQAERNLADLKKGPDALAIMSAESKVQSAEDNVIVAADGKTPKIVRDAYDKSVASLDSMAVTLQKALDDSDDILGIDHQAVNTGLTTFFSILDQAKKNQANASYLLAKKAVGDARAAVDPLQLSGEDPAHIDAAMLGMNDALKMTRTLLDDVRSGLDATLTSASFSQTALDGYVSTIQGDVSGITGAYGTVTNLQNTIQDAKQTYADGQRTLAQAKAEFDALMKGPDASDVEAAEEAVQDRQQTLKDLTKKAEAIDLKSAQNVIEQRTSALQNAQDALRDAQETLGDYTVRAPFDGVIAKLPVKNATQVSASTVLTTLLTKAKIAQVSLNEVDVSKIKVGQKATLTFDAVPNLTIAGTVSEIDLVGTVTQGVVTYAVKIAFLTDDERIKAGMSVSASIITDMRSDVLMVPNGAIRRVGDSASVNILEGIPLTASSTTSGVASETLPQPKMVSVGLSNDQFTEITDGLKEGDPIVARTIQPTTSQTSGAGGSTQGNALRIPGVGGFGGGGGAGGGGFRRQ